MANSKNISFRVEQENKENFNIEDCYRQIDDIIDNDIIILHDNVRNFIFQDVNYSMIRDVTPLWIVDAGNNPESCLSKSQYDSLKQNIKHPILGKLIYYYDLWMKIASVQDRLSAVVTFMRNFYKDIPYRTQYKEEMYTSGGRFSGERETEAYTYLNSIFISYASVFDILSKIAVEQFEFEKYDFTKYGKMKSNDVLYKRKLFKRINESLQNEGMLFSTPEPLVIKKIETFRNEYIHNGPWDLRFSIYYTSIEGEPADVIIYSPDMDEFGHFISSGSRNKFYNQANRINFQLPDMINETTTIIKNTINKISSLYQDNITKKIDDTYTKECMIAIIENSLFAINSADNIEL